MTKVLILADDNFRDEELIYPLYRMKEEGFSVIVAAPGKKEVKGKFGLFVTVDQDVSKVSIFEFDAVIIPGGYAPDKLRMDTNVLHIVKNMHENGKVVAAICHAGWVIASAKIIKGKNVTSYRSIKDDMVNAGANWVDRAVVVDGNLITSRMPDDLPVFCREIIKKLTP